jgi:carbon-monoxide dehydrogenase medium subunit
LLAEEAAAAVVGTSLDDTAIAAAVAAARAIMAPAADARGTAEYRIHVGGIMVARALKRAAARAAS